MTVQPVPSVQPDPSVPSVHQIKYFQGLKKAKTARKLKEQYTLPKPNNSYVKKNWTPILESASRRPFGG